MTFSLKENKIGYIGEFFAMASNCEVIIETQNLSIANSITEIVFNEVLRIQQKFSRYREDNILFKINQSHNNKIKVDKETSLILDFIDQVYSLSEGLFDVSSGILRKVWNFDGSSNIPTKSSVKELLKNIGWNKVKWNNPFIRLAKGMELDFGGFGKEYATDKAIELIKLKYDIPVMVNLGGDLRVTKNKNNNKYWEIIIENINLDKEQYIFKLEDGAVVTSGDSKRFLLKDNIRYSHILNPFTGWSVINAPRTITVGEKTCLEAGFLATLAILKENLAEKFLKEQKIKYYIQW